jgi:YesN/AraC family two-component response regulator
LEFPLLKDEAISTVEDGMTIDKPQMQAQFTIADEKTESINLTDAPIILIVEDHPELQDLISEELQLDYRILKANNGQEGLGMALEHIPDIIISDVMMPYKNGYELCESVKQDERTSHIPFILLTARTAQENKIQGLEAGADDYLGKPFDSQDLRIRVLNLIESRRLLREKFSEKQEMLIYNSEEVVQNPVDKKFIDKVLDIFAQNFSDEQYGVDQMADAFSISKRQLHRKLNAISGLSPGKMLQNYRLQKATELLKNSELQVKEVGFMVGFSSQSYFNKSFKNHFGTTPKEFQKEL